MPRTRHEGRAQSLSRRCDRNEFARSSRFASARTSGSGRAVSARLTARLVGWWGRARFFQLLHLEAQTIQERVPRALPMTIETGQPTILESEDSRYADFVGRIHPVIGSQIASSHRHRSAEPRLRRPRNGWV